MVALEVEPYRIMYISVVLVHISVYSSSAMQAAFIVLVGPFAFFNIQRTKILQLITSVLRNLSQWLV